MVYGIDLGTTNSLIGAGDMLYTGLVSSNVNIKDKVQVPREQAGKDVVSSYKTDMSMSKDGELSVACSAVILAKLAEMGGRAAGEPVKDVVISVPAYFSTSQREAVYKAAGSVGLDVRTLINEPTAAALYVCRDISDLVVVYDLGGGTFDVSIVDSRVGTYTVVATNGIVLGGDDFDRALVEEVFGTMKVPLRFQGEENRKKLQVRVRKAKEEMQRPGVASTRISLQEFKRGDYVLDEETYKRVMREVFYETVVMTQNIIARNIPSCERPKIVFVGGSSNCPYLREMLLSEVDMEEVRSDSDPDYIVAKGVALYAEMLENGTANECVDDVTKRLCIEDDKGQSLTIIDSNTNVPCRNSIIVRNSREGNTLVLKLYQGDSIIATQNEYIGSMVYDFERKVEANEGLVEVTVDVARDGVIALSAMEVMFGESYRQTVQLTAR